MMYAADKHSVTDELYTCVSIFVPRELSYKVPRLHMVNSAYIVSKLTNMSKKLLGVETVFKRHFYIHASTQTQNHALPWQ